MCGYQPTRQKHYGGHVKHVEIVDHTSSVKNRMVFTSFQEKVQCHAFRKVAMEGSEVGTQVCDGRFGWSGIKETV